MTKLMYCVSDLVGVSKETNTILQAAAKYCLMACVVLFLSIDWDRTLDLWGL